MSTFVLLFPFCCSEFYKKSKDPEIPYFNNHFMPEKFDVLIVGAGPAGITTALKLAGSGLKIAIIDKAQFPREKTCGDGLTLDVMNQLPLVSESLAEAFRNFPKKLPSYEAVLFSPDLRHVTIPFRIKSENKPIFTCQRSDFDNLLFGQLKQHENISVFENCKAQKIQITDKHVVISSDEFIFEGSIVVGSDGANSLVSRQMGLKRIPKEQTAVGLTAYYTGLKPLNEKNPIELYLFRDIMPGYLWIFHLGDGKANVGIGMLSSAITTKGIDIKKKFNELMSANPLKDRFVNANCENGIKGHILPLGFDRRPISGNRFLLAGDAAALIEPLTGEGVGNAIRSGRVAAEHILNCFETKDFSATFNKAYDKEVYRRVIPEFKMYNLVQKFIKYPSLLNFVIGSTYSYPSLEDAFNDAFIHLQTSSLKSKLVFTAKIFYIFTLKNLFVTVFGKKRTNEI